jgi:putative glycosyltransferase (TIGR04348 family)
MSRRSASNKPRLVLVTPALAAANNGNWQTAWRWARMLADDYAVRVVQQWDGSEADAMLALHARRSAPSIAAWGQRAPARPLAVTLTGTDLYRDIAAGETSALRSIALAQRLIVLHEGAAADVPAEQRAKCVVCLQSSVARRPLPKTGRRLRALMVGHLRDEKDPRTYFSAARKLADRDDILFDHIGGALDPALGDAARALAAELPHYRWLGERPHAATRRAIQRAHLLVHPSLMEGGAHVVIEAVRSGTPVLASRIPGNLGLLGTDYRGIFAPGDASGLALLLARARADAAMLQGLRDQCERRAPLFEPERERTTLRRIVAELMENGSR